MCGQIVRSRRTPSAPQLGLFFPGAVSGYDANDPPGLLLVILGGKLDPTHRLFINEPSASEVTVILTDDSLAFHTLPARERVALRRKRRLIR